MNSLKNTTGTMAEIDNTISKNRETSEISDAQLHSSKMESLGNLAGGIAHDMNNILASIMAVASAMDAEMSEEHPYADDVKDILSACNRGSRLTRSLLSFARRHRVNFAHINLNDTVKEIGVILSRTASKEVTFSIDLSPLNMPVLADPDQLNQVLMNICMNAIDAMDGKGLITISTDIINAPKTAKKKSVTDPDKYCRITVSDTGSGIPGELHDKIFEPFFTTKPKGKGTGLGLAMAYGTMKKHGGNIYIDPMYKGGTSFIIELPMLKDINPSDLIKSTKQVDSYLKKEHHQGTIMLIDDEDLFRTSAKRILQKLGYTVISFPNGKIASEAFEKCHNDIDAVILDMIMPVMGGRDTFHRLQQIRPDISILIASGFTEEENIKDLMDNGALCFISKPFDMKSLSDALSSIPNNKKTVFN